MILLARCSIHLSQALAEALTSSKAMVGRRLLQCSDLSKCIKVGPFEKCVGFQGQCNQIVSGITATWSAAVDAANEATKVAKKAADVAAAAATKKLNEVKDAAKKAANEAAAAATKTLNEVKAEAEKLANEVKAEATKVLKAVEDAAKAAAATATKFIDDVDNAFGRLGNEIQCATPPPTPKGRAAVVARQWPRTPPAPLCGIVAQRADMWNPVPLAQDYLQWNDKAGTRY